MIKEIEEETAICKMLTEKEHKMTVRPKTGGVLMFMCPDGSVCTIGLYPQHKWEAKTQLNMVILTHKNTTIKISKAVFEETFKVVEE